MKNILVIGNNFKGTSAYYEWNFFEELSKYFNIFYFGHNYPNNQQNTNIYDYLKKHNIDIVLCNHTFHDRAFFLNLKFPNKILMLSDIHKHKRGIDCNDVIKRVESKELIAVLLRSYNSIFTKANLNRIYLFPFSLDEDVYKFDISKKVYDICMLSTNTPSVYPIRHLISRQLRVFANKNKYKIVTGQRTSESKYDINFLKNYTDVKKNKLKVGLEYNKILNQSKIMLTDSSIYRYLVKKYFEGMSTGCLVLADEPLHAEEIGLIDGVNYVKINKNNWQQKAKYYLDNDEERIEIVNNAHQLFLEKHTNKVRVNQFIDILKENNLL